MTAGEPRYRRALRTALRLLLAFGVLEACSAGAISISNRLYGPQIVTRRSIIASQDSEIDRFLSTPGGKLQLDPVLGWRYRPGFIGAGDTVSSQGLRGSREYAAAPPEGSERLAVFGDSFAYCSEVAPPDCWTAKVEAGWHGEVLNYGVPGYGTDQVLLRYLNSPERRVPSPTVLIGFAPVNLRRNVNRYRQFLDPREQLLFKPRFIIDGAGELKRIDPPVGNDAELRAFRGSFEALRRAGLNDHWYEPIIYENPLIDWVASVRLASWIWVKLRRWLFDPERLALDGEINPRSGHFRLQLKLLRDFADSVSSRGSVPYFLLFPNRGSVIRDRDGQSTQYHAIMDSLAVGEVPIIDLIEALREYPGPVSDLFMPGNHYSPAANDLVARTISERFGLNAR